MGPAAILDFSGSGRKTPGPVAARPGAGCCTNVGRSSCYRSAHSPPRRAAGSASSNDHRHPVGARLDGASPKRRRRTTTTPVPESTPRLHAISAAPPYRARAGDALVDGCDQPGRDHPGCVRRWSGCPVGCALPFAETLAKRRLSLGSYTVVSRDYRSAPAHGRRPSTAAWPRLGLAMLVGSVAGRAALPGVRHSRCNVGGMAASSMAVRRVPEVAGNPKRCFRRLGSHWTGRSGSRTISHRAGRAG
jgi:hypothetical protein